MAGEEILGGGGAGLGAVMIWIRLESREGPISLIERRPESPISRSVSACKLRMTCRTGLAAAARPMRTACRS